MYSASNFKELLKKIKAKSLQYQTIKYDVQLQDQGTEGLKGIWSLSFTDQELQNGSQSLDDSTACEL